MSSFKEHLRLCLVASIGFALIISVAGCGSQTPSGNGGISPAASNGLAGRLEAAKAIETRHEHDMALVALAKDAAKAGNGNVTKEAIDAIRTNREHDMAAADAAVLLAKAGKTSDAVTVAKLIKTDALRNETLAKVAKGG